MKRIVLLVSTLFSLNCSTDKEKTDFSAETTIALTGLTVSLDEVLATSIKLQYSYSKLVFTGGDLMTEIWYRQLGESDWNILQVAIENQKTVEIDGLERATEYVAKPVFRVDDMMEQGNEVRFTTLPFNYTFVREKHPNALWVTNIFSDDNYKELGDDLVSFLKKENDSVPLEITIVSEDSLLLESTLEHQSFFDDLDTYEERLELPVTLQLKAFHNGNFAAMELYNIAPKVGQLSFQRLVDCASSNQTKLLFQGLFWDSSIRPENDFNKPDEYAITIRSAENPSTVLLGYTRTDNKSYGLEDGSVDTEDFLGNNCDEGFTIVEDLPVRNPFHRGNFLWLSFPTDVLPEGDYILQFDIRKNETPLMAEPFGFTLRY